MLRKIMTAAAAAALLTTGACATMEEAPAAAAAASASAETIALGQATFSSNCSGCHSGSGRPPAPSVLAMMSPDDIVAALTTGAMAAQGSRLSSEQKQAVAAYLTSG
jgi:mono/diheme cytochrome c family protein